MRALVDAGAPATYSDSGAQYGLHFRKGVWGRDECVPCECSLQAEPARAAHEAPTSWRVHGERVALPIDVVVIEVVRRLGQCVFARHRYDARGFVTGFLLGKNPPGLFA